MSVEISGPALFRSLEKWKPTFIIDEADLAFAKNDDLRAVVNSGWTRGTGVIRCAPETREPRTYPTFAPKAIGMKGKKLPDTTLSRAIVIEMKRKQPGERVRDFNHLDNEQFETLRRKLGRWATDNGEVLKTTPTLPEDFHNRTRANWNPLFAIAELAGEDIVRKVTEAAQEIESRKDQKALSVQLLEDIRKIFASAKGDAIRSKDIVEGLSSDEEGPWSTYGRNDKPIAMRQLANLLRAFGIASETVYPEPGSTKHGKGYKRAQFKEAWNRYLGPEEAPNETPDDQEGASTLPLRKRVAGKPEQHRNNSNFRSGYKRVKSDLTPMQVGADDADDGVYPDRAHKYPDNTRIGNKRNPSSTGTYPLPASEKGGARERAGGTGQNGRRPVCRRVSPYPVKPDKTP